MSESEEMTLEKRAREIVEPCQAVKKNKVTKRTAEQQKIYEGLHDYVIPGLAIECEEIYNNVDMALDFVDKYFEIDADVAIRVMKKHKEKVKEKVAPQALVPPALLSQTSQHLLDFVVNDKEYDDVDKLMAETLPGFNVTDLDNLVKTTTPTNESLWSFNLVYFNGILDFRIPVDENSFYSQNVSSEKYKAMLRKIEDRQGDNQFVIVGSSGCGKTSFGYALAKATFMIYLECPQIDSPDPPTPGGGRFVSEDWKVRKLKNREIIVTMYYRELVCRLLVLRWLRMKFQELLTPYRWLLFTLSKVYAITFTNVFEKLQLNDYNITHGEMICLITEVEAMLDKNGPMVFVDETQRLELFHFQEKNYETKQMEDISIMRALRNGHFCLASSGIFCGTKFGMNQTEFMSMSPSIFKSDEERGAKTITVLGSFKYFCPKMVEKYLTSLFAKVDFGDLMKVLSHMIQGRPRTLVSFVNKLVSFIIDHEVYELTPQALLEVFTEYKNESVNCFIEEIDHMKANELLNEQKIAEILFHSLFPFQSDVSEQSRENTLAFTPEVNQVSNRKYYFYFQFGESFLIDALLERFRMPEFPFALTALRNFVTIFAKQAHTLGTVLDYGVAFSLVCKQNTIFDEILGKGYLIPSLKKYKLHLSRIVQIRSIEEQDLWFDMVLNNPNDNSFPLAVGVAVKNIILIPHVQAAGADVICVAYNEDDPADLLLLTVSNACYEKKVTKAKSSKQTAYKTAGAHSVKFYNKKRYMEGIKNFVHDIKPRVQAKRQLAICIEFPDGPVTAGYYCTSDNNKEDLLIDKTNLDLFFDQSTVKSLQQATNSAELVEVDVESEEESEEEEGL